MMSELLPCDKDIYENGTVVFRTAEIPAVKVDKWVKKVAALSGQPVDWHYVAGWAIVKTTGDIRAVDNALGALMPEHNALLAAART